MSNSCMVAGVVLAFAGSAVGQGESPQLSLIQEKNLQAGNSVPLVTASFAGSFSGGGDECTSATALIGNSLGVPFDLTAATTGAVGQDETLCLIFNGAGLFNDTWYRWTADATGIAQFTSCGALVDTKVAVWPDLCPPLPGSSIACKDDSDCLDTETTIQWEVERGESYLIQVGLFPSLNAAPGAGSFDITVLPRNPTYQYDGNAFHISLGFPDGGTLGWMHGYDAAFVGDAIEQVELFLNFGGGGVPAGTSDLTLAVWNDPNNDFDPADAVLLHSEGGFQAAPAADALARFALSQAVPVDGVFFVGAILTVGPSVFPAAIDRRLNGRGRAWSFTLPDNFTDFELQNLGLTTDLETLQETGFRIVADTIANDPSLNPGDFVFVDADGVWTLRAIGTCTPAVDPGTAVSVNFTANSLTDAVAADVDGDGDRDVLYVVSFPSPGGPSEVSYERTDSSTGTLEDMASPVPSGTIGMRRLATADLNLDGRLDIAGGGSRSAACPAGGAVLTGVADSGGPSILTETTTPGVVQDLTLRDFNSDAFPDLAVVLDNSCGAGGVHVAIGDGLGGFGSLTPVHGALTGEGEVHAIDLNLDGYLDLIVLDRFEVVGDGTARLQVLHGDGTGLFTTGPLTVLDEPGGTFGEGQVGDFDGDGLFDLAIKSTLGNLSILPGDGTGGFRPTERVVLASGDAGLAAARLDFDDRTDLMLAPEALPGGLQLLNSDGVALGCDPEPTTNPVEGRLVALDVNEDGALDVLSLPSGSTDGALFTNQLDSLQVFDTYRVPGGEAAFVDSVLSMQTGSGTVGAPFDDPDAVLGVPDSAGNTGARTYSLGSGGSIDLALDDNVLVNSGSAEMDLIVFRPGPVFDRLLVSARPSGPGTIERLESIGVSVTFGDYVPIGVLEGAANQLDLDEAFPGVAERLLRFDAIRLTDDPAQGTAVGPDAGADVDAVAALTTDTRVPDLIVSEADTPLDGFLNEPFQVSYTVANNGDVAPAQGWSEALLAVDESTGSSILLTQVNTAAVLPPGGSIQRIVQTNYPWFEGTFRLVVETDSGGNIVEGLFEGNNQFTSETFEVTEPPRPELFPQLLIQPVGPVFSSSIVTVGYSVTNGGNLSTGSTEWVDRIYLVEDDETDPSNGDLLATLTRPNALAEGGAGYSNQVQVVLPKDFSGTRRISVVTDAFFQITESDENNNGVIGSQSFEVMLEPQPDLVVDTVSFPVSTYNAGTILPVTWEDRNAGQGITDLPSWTDRVFLSTNDLPDVTGDRELLDQVVLGFLVFDQTHVVESNVPLPVDLPTGTYYLKVYSDYLDQITEDDVGGEANNIQVSGPLDILFGLPPDLASPGAEPVGALVVGTNARIDWDVSISASTWPDLPFGTLDRVYLSPTGALDGMETFLGQQPSFRSYGATASGYSRSIQPFLPTTLTPQPHYLILELDWDEGLFESNESNNLLITGPFDVVLTSADLAIASEPTTDTTGSAQQPVQLVWTVTNVGDEATPVANWRDSVRLVGPSVNRLLTEVNRSGAVAPMGEYTVQRSVVLPDVPPGAGYTLEFRTDANASVFEPGSATNNTVSVPFEVLTTGADLRVTEATPSVTTESAGGSISLSWTVENRGALPTGVSFWRDRVYLSQDAVADGSDDLLKQVLRSGELGVNGSYSVTRTVEMPLVQSGIYQLLVVTDAVDQVVEEGPASNNTFAIPFVIDMDGADLIPTLGTPGMAQGGLPLAIQYSVLNAGNLQTPASLWSDRVWLSGDGVLDGVNDFELGRVQRTSELAMNDSYNVMATFPVPVEISGMQWLIVEADLNDQVFETDETNNLDTTRMRLQVNAATPANLVVEDVVADPTGIAGQPLNVSWTVKNTGAGTTNVDMWSDEVYLSLDTILDPMEDFLIGSFDHDLFLDVDMPPTVDGTIPVMTTLDLPTGVAGPFFLLVATNVGDSVYEDGQTLDNVGTSIGQTIVTLPDPSNLRIAQVEPATTMAVLGQEISIDWTVENQAGSIANGTWEDSLYLSLDDQLDLTDVRIGNFNVAPGGLDVGESVALNTLTSGVAPKTPGVVPDFYHVIALTDSKDRIRELDEGDNCRSSLGLLQVTAPSLSVAQSGDVDSATIQLGTDQEAWYELQAPAGLALRVTVTHSLSNAWTELYIREEGIPTPGLFDLRFRSPGSETQSLVIPNSSGARYFVLARTTANGGMADATLTLEALGYEAEIVQPDVVGTGLVTLSIEGGRIDETTLVQLTQLPAGMTYSSIELQPQSTFELLALMDLTGATPGDYRLDVTGPEPSQSLTVTVEPATAPLLGVTTVLSPSIRKGGSGEAQLRLSNLGNVNVPRGLLVAGTIANEGAVADTDLILFEPLDPNGDRFGVDGPRESIVLQVEDLGPSQEQVLRFQIEVGDSYPSSEVILGLSGRSLTAGSATQFGDDVSRALRLAVLLDSDSTEELFNLASSPALWGSAVSAALADNGSGIAPSGELPTTGCELVQELAQLASAALPAGQVVPQNSIDFVCGKLYETAFQGVGAQTDELFPTACDSNQSSATVLVGPGSSVTPVSLCAQTPTSDDPNEKNGPGGLGARRLVSSRQPLCYRVHFENVETAQAPASRVQIRDELDPSFDLSTVRMRAIHFGETVLEFEPSITYQGMVDATEELGVLVSVFSSVDETNREVYVDLRSLDPNTLQPPTDGLTGLLPPEDGSGVGQGFVEFDVMPFQSSAVMAAPVQTGTVVNNVSQIKFDVNGSIGTNRVSNALDAMGPTSALAAAQPSTMVDMLQISWDGDDLEEEGSGLRDFTIYSSKDGGPFMPLIVATTDRAMEVPVDQGANYRFYSVARDRTGNVQEELTIVSVDIPVDCDMNGTPDDQDIQSGAPDCDLNGVPDVCELALDCNSNGILDACELDCDSNGIPDDCSIAAGEPDCNGNGIPDVCELTDDCNANAIPDECEPDCDADGILDECALQMGAADCNSNGLPDECELRVDCNFNGIPDPCDADCDLDGTPDDCEIKAGAPDCNSNGLPDECELLEDCNMNGVPDDCDSDCDGDGVPDDCSIASGRADCNSNGVPDECEVGADCNRNGVPDECDVDCDSDGIPDDCEIASGAVDCDRNGVLDECELALDCNSNGVLDVCDPDCDSDGVPDDCALAGGALDCNDNGVPDVCELMTDCNSNGIPDDCDVNSGASLDVNMSGIPDECEDVQHFCFGDGGDQNGCTDCPCNNNAAPGTIGGCLNSTGGSAFLEPSGSTSVLARDLRFEVTGLPARTIAILLSADQQAPANVVSPCFGLNTGIHSVDMDGLRCITGGVLRHGARTANIQGEVGTTTRGWGDPDPLFQFPQFTAGATKHFQVYHRDLTFGACDKAINSTQGVSVQFQP